ncbi:cobalamin-binding protein [Pseudoflavonifractor sp. 524-17]|uniref:corrinoid protein n=1 Tax=Pseudoflavonifractor sp. 524-17 TaxID=2304577 RepID=UPI00137AFC18|nr:corrinoid protein [Pseudoflavonifractor sp. 524-17]NCE64667.1 cobalamin-binding protein [Pseudoflavonifractor sp. 524-17]
MSTLTELSQAVEKGRAKLVKALVPQALEAGTSPKAILEEGLLSGMNAVGEQFKTGVMFVPQVLMAAKAMNAGMELLKPHLSGESAGFKGRACLGTVKGDLHDIGKNLVRMMFEGQGIEVIDLGVDVAPEAFVQTAIEKDCQIIACSALLTTSMPSMGAVVEAAKAAGIRDKVKIMVGGAPVTDRFCTDIGADAYTPDAATAATVAAGFLA